MVIVTGGEGDLAYANGKRDFETMPARVPVYDGGYPSIGHDGTCNEDVIAISKACRILRAK